MKVKKFSDTLSEEFKFGGDTPSKIFGKDYIQNLLFKVKKMVPQSKIDQFIEENRDEVKKLAEQLSGEDGNLDMNKVASFVKKNK